MVSFRREYKDNGNRRVSVFDGEPGASVRDEIKEAIRILNRDRTPRCDLHLNGTMVILYRNSKIDEAFAEFRTKIEERSRRKS